MILTSTLFKDKCVNILLFSRTTEFAGFTLPPNTHVIPLLYAIHMDPELWPEPEAFRPERFLSADGSELVKPEHFIPFGIGQRMCLGNQLAEKELFLLFSSLLHAFDVRAASPADLPSLRGVAAVTIKPVDFDVVFVPRTSAAATTATTTTTLTSPRIYG